jgi:single-strand DNA-binding protein
MEIFGRLTADAKVNELKDGRKVVNFNIASNDSYKPKGSNEIKKVTTYFNCSYWINSNIAKFLTKGSLVELYGRVGVNAYISTEGEPKASLTFYVIKIKLHGKPAGERKENAVPVDAVESTGTSDDLPF